MGKLIMLKLRGKVKAYNKTWYESRLLTVTLNPDLPHVLRKKYVLIQDNELTPFPGFAAIILRNQKSEIFDSIIDAENIYIVGEDYDYVGEGDIVRLNPTTDYISSLFRRNSNHNTVLLTERCNNYCLMCSQPPKNSDDTWLIEEAFELINLVPNQTQRLGFSGGEPTLYGMRFVELIQHAKNYLPSTSLDVLSNGRAFKDERFAQALGNVAHQDLMIGIPIYSDDPVRHDYVVQAKGAFDETIQGILNLKRFGQKVEIRIVIHKETLPRLVQTCEFIARNLLFVDHVALMGLEITGFTRANLGLLWTDPFEYKDILSEAVNLLTSYGLNTSVYNHQLCTVNADVLPAYRQSISDWKNEYIDKCESCTRKSECGGFFSSAVQYRHSDFITPFN
jgi:His-Xaa-Ser system radical SAM maturase HxsC